MIEEHKAYYRAEEFGTLPYLSESAAVFYALEHYKPTGLSGMVIGSQSPWIEAMLLFYGAKQVTTAEYAPLSILHPDIKYVHPIDLAKNWQDYANLDFVVSFSSIEHSGLGRYGDPLDPNGDLREVDKIRCLLKAGGLLYIGLPSGQDQVVFNAHRLYGYIRWPMIAAGFEFLGAFHAKHREIQRTPPRIASNDYKQILFVLKKI
uniref:DUF268 domain-containing protein n=1 Tax=Plectus sambesii TaxID=2011161 RepID=A0A914XFF9_9BILA